MSANNTTRTSLQQTSAHSIYEIAIGVAIGLILVVGLIHLVDAPDNFGEAPYKGFLFVINGLGALLAAYGIYSQRKWGWWLGALVAGGAFVMYIISRTIGLPVIGVDDAWLEPMGILSLIVEAGFAVLFAGYLFTRGSNSSPEVINE